MKTKYFEVASNNNILRGLVHLPKIAQKENPAIVIVHGYFSANKIGPQRLFVNIAEALSSKGFYVYRFDFSGMGESDGSIENIKFCDHVTDLTNVLQFVQTRHAKQKTNVIAHCMGCNSTLEILSKHSENLARVVFLAPFFANDITMKRIFDTDQLDSIINNGHVYRKGLYADYSFFSDNNEEMFKHRLNLSTRQIDAILAGDDQFSPIECSQLAFACVNNVRVFVAPDADHNFLKMQRKLIDLICRIWGVV